MGTLIKKNLRSDLVTDIGSVKSRMAVLPYSTFWTMTVAKRCALSCLSFSVRLL
jgi:hypothetical protein